LANSEKIDKLVESVVQERKREEIMREFKKGLKAKFTKEAEVNLLVNDALTIIENDKIELRGARNGFYKCTLRIAQSSTFTLLISLSIVLNTAILALDRHPIEP